MNNHYKLKARLLENKYGPFVEEFKQHNDDRILVPNILAQVLEACKAMESVENNLVRVAINEKIREEDAEMEKIVTRFTGRVFDGTKWNKKKEDTAEKTVKYKDYCEALNELTEKYRPHFITFYSEKDWKSKTVRLLVNWSAIGSVPAEQARDYAGWIDPPMMRRTSSTTATASSTGRTEDEGEEKP